MAVDAGHRLESQKNRDAAHVAVPEEFPEVHALCVRLPQHPDEVGALACHLTSPHTLPVPHNDRLVRDGVLDFRVNLRPPPSPTYRGSYA